MCSCHLCCLAAWEGAAKRQQAADLLPSSTRVARRCRALRLAGSWASRLRAASTCSSRLHWQMLSGRPHSWLSCTIRTRKLVSWPTASGRAAMRLEETSRVCSRAMWHRASGSASSLHLCTFAVQPREFEPSSPALRVCFLNISVQAVCCSKGGCWRPGAAGVILQIGEQLKCSIEKVSTREAAYTTMGCQQSYLLWSNMTVSRVCSAARQDSPAVQSRLCEALRR